MNPNLIFEQLFEPESCTYTYLISSKRGGEGILIDPVRSQCQTYLSLLDKHNLKSFSCARYSCSCRPCNRGWRPYKIALVVRL